MQGLLQKDAAARPSLKSILLGEWFNDVRVLNPPHLDDPNPRNPRDDTAEVVRWDALRQAAPLRPWEAAVANHKASRPRFTDASVRSTMLGLIKEVNGCSNCGAAASVGPVTELRDAVCLECGTPAPVPLHGGGDGGGGGGGGGP